MKFCSGCKIDKPFDSFHKRTASKNGLQSICKDCSRIRVNEYYREHKDKRRIIDKRNAYRKYGMSVDDYHQRCRDQDNRCLLCQKIGKLVVDHDHVTGVIRGLLCTGCNTSLGQFGDNIEGLQKAIYYLQASLVQR